MHPQLAQGEAVLADVFTIQEGKRGKGWQHGEQEAKASQNHESNRAGKVFSQGLFIRGRQVLENRTPRCDGPAINPRARLRPLRCVAALSPLQMTAALQ
jgi:hypothetical protein